MKFSVKKMVTLALLSTIAYIAAFAFTLLGITFFPFTAPYLTYDPKDVVIVIGGFLYGPLAAFLISAVVCLLEMFTVSRTVFIGFIFNLIASAAFCCPAALIYKYEKSLKSVAIGLVVGTLCMTAVMLPANYILTPLYTGAARETVVAMLLPVTLPFNLLKGAINSLLVLALYKPIKDVFFKADLR